MAYTFQTFTINQVHTAAQMNQTEVNARDHQHGASGVLTVPAGGLADGAVNVAAKLASNVVTTAKILDANVTQGKLAKPSVGTPELKLAQGSATTGDAIIAVNQFAFGSPSVTVLEGTNVGIITIGTGASGRNWQTDCTGVCPPCSVTYTWDYITASGNPQLWAICGILGDIDALWESEDAAFADETISPLSGSPMPVGGYMTKVQWPPSPATVLELLSRIDMVSIPASIITAWRQQCIRRGLPPLADLSEVQTVIDPQQKRWYLQLLFRECAAAAGPQALSAFLIAHCRVSQTGTISVKP